MLVENFTNFDFYVSLDTSLEIVSNCITKLYDNRKLFYDDFSFLRQESQCAVSIEGNKLGTTMGRGSHHI